MPLVPPNLDDRRFDDLVAEAKRIIAQTCPEWTDLSPGDPGMVLVELFAHLTEVMLYRLNRLPDKAFVELLRLIGVRLQPPSAAGVTLPDLRVAYRRDGPPSVSAVLVVHALTGSADAAGDWWEPLIGAGKALDTDERQIICLNLLGSCYGTTGPREVADFPPVTTRDLARAQWVALDALGVERLELVVGGSLGLYAWRAPRLAAATAQHGAGRRHGGSRQRAGAGAGRVARRPGARRAAPAACTWCPRPNTRAFCPSCCRPTPKCQCAR